MSRSLFALASALFLVACPVEKQVSAPSAGPSSIPTSMPSSMPASMPASHPPVGPASAPSGQPSDGKPFSGLVKLAEGLPADAAKPSDVLFVMARIAVEGQPAALVAVQRHVNVTFPFRYEISAKDLMMPGTPFAGPFTVQARLDRDGDPMTKTDEDLYAEFAGTVKGGDEGVHLVLTARAAP